MPSFVELDEQRRIEALTSGVANNGWKAATLLSMEEGVPYSPAALDSRVIEFVGSRYADERASINFCTDSLEPIGMVVKASIGGDFTLLYEKTKDGFTYGDAAIARFLHLTHELDLSLKSINRSTQTRGTVRHGYVVARLLELLSDGEEHQVIEISSTAGFRNPKVISDGLRSLSSIGLVEYDSVPTDSYGERKIIGYATAAVLDREKLAFYARNPEMLMADARAVSPLFRYGGHLKNSVAMGLDVIEANDLAQRLNIHQDTGSKIVSVLCALGVYKRDKFTKGYSSSSRITTRGMLAYELAFAPVLYLAREPESPEVIRAFGEVAREIDVHSSLREELLRYAKEKRRGPGGQAETDTEVLTLARLVAEGGKDTFRRMDIVDCSRELDMSMHNSTISKALASLVRNGRLERVDAPPDAIRKATHYRIKQ